MSASLILICVIFSAVFIFAFFSFRTILNRLQQEFDQSISGKNQHIHELEQRCQNIESLMHAKTTESQTLAHEKHKLEINQASHEHQVIALQNQLKAYADHAETQKRELKQRLDEVMSERHDLMLSQQQMQHRLQSLNAELVEVNTSIKERDLHFKSQTDQLHAQKNLFSEHFKTLAQEILDAKAKHLQERTNEGVNALMQPFKASIDAFKKEVQDIHHRETSQQGELRKELQTLKELNQKITTEAHQLSTALTGQKKLQGNWGELVLENVLERSGLRLGHDYKREVSFSTENGRLRPDVVVYLPQGKHLVIDAKVSLNAYTRYVNAEDDTSRYEALRDHISAFAGRIDDLASKDYWQLPGLNSPEMVFMFVPIESAFVEALKADESLFQKAIDNNILIATPTTLLTSLNIVRQLWRYEDQNKHTAALAAKAETVFKKLNTFLKSFDDLRKGLQRANEAYSAAESQLLSGKGNLVKQVSEFKKLAPSIKQELPEYYSEKADLEIDLISAEESELSSNT